MRLSKVLKRRDANPMIMGTFYKAVIEAVLLYGSESWVLSENNLKKLRSFHNKCARHMVGYHIQQIDNNNWIHPPTKDVLEKCGLKPIEYYISNRRCTLREYIFKENRKIYFDCLNSKPIQTNINQLTWWGENQTKVFGIRNFI